MANIADQYMQMRRSCD